MNVLHNCNPARLILFLSIILKESCGISIPTSRRVAVAIVDSIFRDDSELLLGWEMNSHLFICIGCFLLFVSGRLIISSI